MASLRTYRFGASRRQRRSIASPLCDVRRRFGPWRTALFTANTGNCRTRLVVGADPFCSRPGRAGRARAIPRIFLTISQRRYSRELESMVAGWKAGGICGAYATGIIDAAVHTYVSAWTWALIPELLLNSTVCTIIATQCCPNGSSPLSHPYPQHSFYPL
ncbi:hypothetical protein H4582DRAFT_1581163 [Lactarius indigo]|nr:hypothetical protein H4582DRAFT_1581163 [Lactarius indigo]